MTLTDEQLLGIPINPINNLVIDFENLFSRPDGTTILPPVGTNGIPSGVDAPASSINYLMNKRSNIEKSASQRPMVRLADKNLNVVAELTGELSIDFEEVMTDSGTAKYVVHWSNWMVDYIVNLTTVEEDLHLIIDPIPTQPSWRTRWGGKLHTINVIRAKDGTNTVELHGVANREHAKRLLFAANPILMPEVQLPRMWILPGPLRSILFVSCFINLARLFMPGFSFWANMFNPLSWLNPLNADSLSQINPLNWPIQVAWIDPVTDQSRWSVLAATWTTWHDATTDLLKDAGVMMRAYTWLTTDVDSPYDELVDSVTGAVDGFADLVESILGNDPDLAQQLMDDAKSVLRPGRNCVIFSFEDKSGQTGPTGTALDGLLNVIGVTLDDLVSSTLINAQTGLTLDGQPLYDLQGNEFPIFESLLGVAPEPPKVIWREGAFNSAGNMTGFTGQLEANHTLNKGSPKKVMTGGKSPAIVNDGLHFAIKWGLAQLSDLINAGLGTFVNTAFITPLTMGIQNLYNDELDNVFLAWEQLTNPLTLLWGGDVDFQEYFERGNSVAYTVASIVTLQTALWKTRSYQGFKCQVLNGYPWTIDVDTGLGDRNGWEFGGVIYVDQIHGVKRSVAKGQPLLTTLTVGEDRDKSDPLMSTIRALQGVYQLFGAFLGEGTIFQ